MNEEAVHGITTVGIDLGKTVFHLVGLKSAGETVVRKRFSRTQLLRFTSNLKVRLIGMEACAGAHFLGRALREQGHGVRLMPAQYVRPLREDEKERLDGLMKDAPRPGWTPAISPQVVTELVARTTRWLPVSRQRGDRC